jgi:hypothetical protein
MYGKIMTFLFDESLYEYPLEGVQPVGIKGSVRDLAVREYIAKYFASTHRSIPWQYGKIKRLFPASTDNSFMEIN